MTSRILHRVALAALASLVFGAASIVPGLAVPTVGAATGWAQFGKPTAESSFAAGVTFSQTVTIDREVRRAELLLTFADAVGPTVIPVPTPSGTGARTLTYEADPAVDGHMLPNTPLTVRWRLVAAADATDVEVGPEVRITYVDDRFSWRTEAGAQVRVHWYEGTSAFGARALKIGEDAVREASELLQVAETDPVDFFVYADQGAFYDALGPGTRENVGGQANAEIRTMFALIPTDEIDQAWVGIVIPHELTHLVFDTASHNPYHFPPRWLNEGLAVNLSQGYDPSDRGTVEDAAGSGTLIPLDGLTGQFPTSFERFSLAYAEGVSAVDYLIRVYGRDSLVSLIRSYAGGRTDDEAFRAALGVDLSAFGAAWLADLGAASPTKFGPQTAPPGPIPAAWLIDPGASASPAVPGAATASPGSSAEPGDGAPAADAPGLLFLALIAAIALVVIVFVMAARRRRARPGSAE
jgi:peptidase MA superfamily protein